MYTVLLVIHTILVLFLILAVLIQRTDSDGLGGLGGGGNQFLTGRSTANFLTRTTAILATAFMVTSLALAIIASRSTMPGKSILDTVPQEKAIERTPMKEKEIPAEKTPAPAVPKPE